MTLKSGTLAVALAAFTITAPAADLHVPADHETIQAAVDAATSGDTIHVAAGVYREQVRIIEKSVTLLGEPGTIIRAYPNMAPIAEFENVNRRAMVLVLRSPNVVLRHLAFEGDQLGDQQAASFNGALIIDSGGAIEDCRFVGIREAIPGSVHCEAIEVLNDLPGAPHLEINIRRNTIIDCYSGIRLVGTRGRISLTISVADNVISGVGPTSAASDLEGIEVQEGMVGEVVRNTVSNFSYVGDGADRLAPLAFGILGISTGPLENLIELHPLRFEDNSLFDNQLHFALALCSGSTITRNRMEGEGDGIHPAGLWLTGENLAVEDNEFVNLTTGILVGGEDPDFGTVFGIAVNADLANNRFRDVATPVEIQPHATATEEGTLLYPYPAPQLTFETSVLISWPAFYGEDRSLQRSEDFENWHFLDLPIVRDNDRLLVAVPTAETREFFRLIETTAP